MSGLRTVSGKLPYSGSNFTVVPSILAVDGVTWRTFRAVNQGINLITNPAGRTTSGTVTSRTNICTNPSFETGSAGWTSSDPALANLVQQSSAGAYVGSKSLVFGGSGAVFAGMTTASGASYTTTAHVKHPVGATKAMAYMVESPTTTAAQGPGLRYGMAKNGPGVLVEEATTNLWMNPGMEVNTSGYSVLSGGATITRDTGTAFIGSASLKVVRATTADNRLVRLSYSPSDNWAVYLPTGTYTMSMMVKGNSGQTSNQVAPMFESQPQNTSGYATGTINSTTYAALDGLWHRASTIFTVTGSGTAVLNFNTYLNGANNNGAVGDTFFVDCVQLEAKSYATSYVDGGLGTGYSWDTTTNLVSNPGFETNTTGWAPTDASQGAITRSTGASFQGTASGIVNGGAYTTVTTVAGSTYTPSCWVRTGSGAAATGQVFLTKSLAASLASGTGLRYAQAKNGPGPLVEEGTTNLCLNPNVVGTSNIFSAGTGTITITADATQAYIGAGSAKVVVDGTVSAQGAQFYTGDQPPGTYTGSVWVKGTSGVQVNFWTRCYMYNGGSVKDSTSTTMTLNGSWQRLVSTPMTFAAADGYCNNIAILVRTTAATSTTFWLDNAQIEQKSYATTYTDGSLGSAYSWDTTTNLINNPSFETNTTGWNGSASTIALDTTQHYSGAQSLKVTATGAQSYSTASFGSSSRMAVTGNSWYTLSGYLKSEVTGRAAIAKIYWYDSTGTIITSVSSPNTTNVTSTTAWTRVVFSAQAPSNAASCYIDLFTTAGTTLPAGENFWVDAVQLEARSYATPYGNAGSANTTSSSRAYTNMRYTLSPTVTLGASSGIVTAKVVSIPASGTDEFLDVGKQSSTDSIRIYYAPSASQIGAQIYANNVQIGTAIINSFTLAVGDTISAGYTYDGTTLKLYVSKNGAAALTASSPLTATFANPADQVALGHNPFNQSGTISNSAHENVMVFSTAIDATTMTNFVNGSTLPSNAAARADCVWSNYVNDPPRNPVGINNAGGWTRLVSNSRVTTSGETRSDLVVLAPGTDAINYLWLDGAQVESRNYATPVSNTGANSTVSSSRIVGLQQYALNGFSFSAHTLVAQFVVGPRMTSGTFTTILRVETTTGNTVPAIAVSAANQVQYTDNKQKGQILNTTLNVGDKVLLVGGYDGTNYFVYASVNGAAPTTTASAAPVLTPGPVTALSAKDANTPVENMMVFNRVLSSAEVANLASGATTFQAMAGDAQCIFSAATNDPVALQTVAQGAYNKLTSTRKTTSRETRSDLVVMTDTPTGSISLVLLDSVLCERGTTATSYYDGSTPVPLRINWVQTPSFEDGTTGVTSGIGSGQAPKTTVVATDQVHSGTYSLKSSITGAGQFGIKGTTNNLVLRNGDVLTWSFWIYSTKAGTITPYWEGNNAAGTYTGSGGGSAVTVPANAWTQISGTFTANSSYDFSYVNGVGAYQLAVDVGDTVWVDDFIAEKNSAGGPFFTGNTAADPTNSLAYGWVGIANQSRSYSYSSELGTAWTGTANASTSIQRGTGINRWTHTTGSGERTVPYQHTESGMSFARYLIPAGSEAASWRIAMIGNSDDFSSIVAGDVVTLIMRARVGGALSTWTTNNVTICQGSTAGGIGAQFTPTPVLTTAWQEFRATATAVTAPSGAVVLYYSMPGTAFSADAWMDVAHVAVIRGNFPGPYFDGSGPYTPEPDYIYSWSGAADASTSLATP